MTMLLAALAASLAALLATSPLRSPVERLRSPSGVADAGAATTMLVGGSPTAPMVWVGLRRKSTSGWVEVADRWAAGLGAGGAPAACLIRALEAGGPELARAAQRIRAGACPDEVLTTLGDQRRHEGARALAACWSLIASLGTQGAATVHGVAQALREDAALRDEVRAQLAAPRASARLVALLPLVGPLLGALLGADTVEVLVGTQVGRLLLAGGLLLNLAGWWWVRSLVRRAERRA